MEITDRLGDLVLQLAEACGIRAIALLQLNQNEAALEVSRRWTELEPASALAWSQLASAAWSAERLYLAQQAFEQAILLAPNDAELLAEFAWFMASARGPRLAEQAARKAIDADEKSPTAWAALGMAQWRLHRRKQARESLGQALKLDPNSARAQSAMMLLLEDQRDDRNALALARILEDTPGTEQIIEAVRRAAKQRQLVRRLAERQMPPPTQGGQSSPLWSLLNWYRVLAIGSLVVMTAVVFCTAGSTWRWATLPAWILLIWFLVRCLR